MREGYLAKARCGTLFFDEVAELSPAVQTSCCASWRTAAIGCSAPFATADSRRIVAATHVDLKERVQKKLSRRTSITAWSLTVRVAQPGRT